MRDFSATMIASASSEAPASGTPIVWIVRMPLLTSMLARSVAPVKSSAMQPSSGRAGAAEEAREEAVMAAVGISGRAAA
ncbi:hypothetical protein [Burkholderia gladioli]|uniref:hypothetical protein n=1 Tax=Burkholderia gladioli TaxID=28095 RepID=UPI0021B15DCF|nr:hypothetical protein [Burkholderia gladioli]